MISEFIVNDDYDGERLDVFLSSLSPELSRSYIQKLIKDGLVTASASKVKPGSRVSAGETITLDTPEKIIPEITPEDIPLDIVYEDDDVLVVNKPKGMVVHPAAGHYSHTLVNALMFHCRDSLSGINGVLRPGIVHRIDRDTTGLLIVCKNDNAHRCIAEQIKEHSVVRRYYAICCGTFREPEGRIELPIGRSEKDRKKMAVDLHNGRPAITNYKVIEQFDRYAWVECRLETGRTHQIRVHMAHSHHPLLGDEVYGQGCPSKWNTEGQALHAYRIGFIHPSTGKYLEFDSELPAYFSGILRSLGSRKLQEIYPDVKTGR